VLTCSAAEGTGIGALWAQVEAYASARGDGLAARRQEQEAALLTAAAEVRSSGRGLAHLAWGGRVVMARRTAQELVVEQLREAWRTGALAGAPAALARVRPPEAHPKGLALVHTVHVWRAPEPPGPPGARRRGHAADRRRAARR
jgi:hypothetical protein